MAMCIFHSLLLFNIFVYVNNTPDCCTAGQTMQEGNFFYECDNGNYKGVACLIPNAAERIERGGTVISDGFEYSCYTTKDGKLKFEPTACMVSNKRLRINSGDTAVSEHYMVLCKKDDRGVHWAYTACQDDYGHCVKYGQRFTLNGSVFHDLCIFEQKMVKIGLKEQYFHMDDCSPWDTVDTKRMDDLNCE